MYTKEDEYACEGCGAWWTLYDGLFFGKYGNGLKADHPDDCSWYVDMMTEYHLRMASSGLSAVMDAWWETDAPVLL